MCRHACPVSEAAGIETLTPQAKMHQLNRLRNRLVPWNDKTTEALYACTGCRQCTNYCRHGNEPGLVLFAGRAEANARGGAHPALESYPDRFRNRDQRLARDQAERFEGHATGKQTAVGFFPGCDALDKNAADVETALDLFEHLEIEPVSLAVGGVACAGYPLLAAGYPDMFRWQANRVASELRGYRTVIVNCSACVYAMKSQYPAEGVTIGAEILSLAEFLAQKLPSIEQPETLKPVYYHDPCYLARYSGVVEPPRRVLGKVAEVREFAWSGSDTDCCGGAGLLPKTMPFVANRMAKNRLKDVSSRGGGTVVTSCGTCAFMLKSNAPSNIEVKDLATAVADAVGLNADDPGEAL